MAPTARASRLIAFDAARAFARSLRLPNRDAWRQWASKNRAALDSHRVPSRPDIAYASSGWRDWTDWLKADARTISYRPAVLQRFMPYQDWLKWVASQSFRTKADYNDWCKANPAERKLLGVPSAPALVYADFPGWLVALRKPPTTSFRGRRPNPYVPLREAKKFAASLPLNPRTAAGWHAWARDHRSILRSQRIPFAPDRVAEYRKEFRGWRDFLNKDRRPTINRKR
jgi:hypothetical protein